MGAKTTVIKKNLNPQWNEEFQLGVLPEQLEKEELELEVHDKDFFNDDDIGFARIPLSTISRRGAKVHTVTLAKVDTGTLQISLHITGSA